MYSRALRPGERVKKCSNCSKDLPEAALHCVFCGAKQAAAPAVQPGVAKTAFGYSANEVMAQLGQQQPQQGGYQPPRPQSGPQPQPYVTTRDAVRSDASAPCASSTRAQTSAGSG